MGKERAEEILGFWFGDESGPHAIGPNHSMWFTGSEEMDARCARFAEDHRRGAAGELDDWQHEPRPCLALVILLDQLSRNLYRGRPEAFANDPKAQWLALGAVERGLDRGLRSVERAFMYMPFMHAEDLELQHRSLDAFAVLAAEVPAELREPYENFHRYAVLHAIIVSRFERYPHRNAVLGRRSTPEELEFLKQPGSSF